MCIVLLINNAVNFEMCPLCTITNVPVIHALLCMFIQGSVEFPNFIRQSHKEWPSIDVCEFLSPTQGNLHIACTCNFWRHESRQYILCQGSPCN